jgi:hypothetical protein
MLKYSVFHLRRGCKFKVMSYSKPLGS